MSLLDQIKDGLTRVLPAKSPSNNAMSGGIGGGHGMVPFQDDMIVSKPTIVFHLSQVFFNFLAMACFASVASFQARFKIGPSGLSSFAIFISILGIFLPLFLLLIPVVYEKYDKFNRLARTLKEVRVAFILTGAGSVASLLIAFIVTISACTDPGCKDAS
jgi:RsiW-degrading membrane proteinase PrsW (M82 family)